MSITGRATAAVGPAYLRMDGWAGRHDYAVMVVGETPKKYRIKAVMDTKLPRRMLRAGDEALVPKHAIKFSVAR